MENKAIAVPPLELEHYGGLIRFELSTRSFKIFPAHYSALAYNNSEKLWQNIRRSTELEQRKHELGTTTARRVCFYSLIGNQYRRQFAEEIRCTCEEF